MKNRWGGGGGETVNEDDNVVTFNIELCRRAVRTEELIHLVLLHELEHCVTIATSTCEHYFHGNAFIKTLETLHHYDSNADFYIPSRQVECSLVGVTQVAIQWL